MTQNAQDKQDEQDLLEVTQLGEAVLRLCREATEPSIAAMALTESLVAIASHSMSGGPCCLLSDLFTTLLDLAPASDEEYDDRAEDLLGRLLNHLAHNGYENALNKFGVIVEPDSRGHFH